MFKSSSIFRLFCTHYVAQGLSSSLSKNNMSAACESSGKILRIWTHVTLGMLHPLLTSSSELFHFFYFVDNGKNEKSKLKNTAVRMSWIKDNRKNVLNLFTSYNFFLLSLSLSAQQNIRKMQLCFTATTSITIHKNDCKSSSQDTNPAVIHPQHLHLKRLC